MKMSRKAMYIVMSIIVVFILVIVGISISGKKAKKASSGNVETTTKSKEKTSKSTEQTTINSSAQETTLTQETTTAGQPAAATKTLYVIANGANVRDNYENGSKVGHLNQNDAVVVVGEPIADSSGMLWYQLDNGNYVCADLLGTEPVGNNSSSSASNSGSNGSGSSGNRSRNGSGSANNSGNNDYGDNSGDNGGSDNNDNGGNNGGSGGGSNNGTGGLNTSYVGYRTDCEQAFRSPFLSMRANEIPKYGWTGDMRNRLINATWNESLYHVAQARAKEIVADFSHNSAHNYTSGYNINEALAINNVVSNDASVSANHVLNGWFNSPGHYNVITHGDQYAVACYQYYNSFFWVFVSGDYNMYCADAYAAYNSFDWQECGFNDEQSYKNWLYTQFTNDRGNRVIW